VNQLLCGEDSKVWKLITHFFNKYKLKVAAQYSCTGAVGETALIMKLKIDKNDFMSYGAGLKWLSAFPGEDERLYPPLTYLKPTTRTQSETVEGINFKIVEVDTLGVVRR